MNTMETSVWYPERSASLANDSHTSMECLNCTSETLVPLSPVHEHHSIVKREREYHKKQSSSSSKNAMLHLAGAKKKIKRIMKREHGIDVGSSTVNRYLRKHGKVDLKISEKNRRAWEQKMVRERDSVLQPVLRVKHRPPKEIKDYKPGALIEKDMKYVVKQGQFINTEKVGTQENFWYQHTEIDSFSRIRAVELVEDSSSATAAQAHERAATLFPFPLACENADNDSENNGVFADALQTDNVYHFCSKAITPTDNPRVERSHLTDDIEFYNRGNIHKTFEEQRKANATLEQTYNYERPHQALGYLTPMEFYELWKKNPEDAYAIVRKYQAYLAKQRIRLASARRIKKKE